MGHTDLLRGCNALYRVHFSPAVARVRVDRPAGAAFHPRMGDLLCHVLSHTGASDRNQAAGIERGPMRAADLRPAERGAVRYLFHRSQSGGRKADHYAEIRRGAFHLAGSPGCRHNWVYQDLRRPSGVDPNRGCGRPQRRAGTIHLHSHSGTTGTQAGGAKRAGRNPGHRPY